MLGRGTARVGVPLPLSRAPGLPAAPEPPLPGFMGPTTFNAPVSIPTLPSLEVQVRTLTSRRTDTGGFIVFGALVLISAVLTAAVLIGQAVNARHPASYVDPSPPQLRFVLSDAEVLRHGQVRRRLQRGDSVWVSSLANGDVAVFVSAERTEVVGFLWGHLLSPSPPAR